METPSKGHDLSLYAMLFQELTANWFDPQTCLPGTIGDRLITFSQRDREAEGAFSEIRSRIADLSGWMWKCLELVSS